ncbi:MAG: hypothetical protein HYV26_07725 [Candidatus Hydrogenedentes bacterium]|nr:hypothetical protein [Candidatus Hydrogenedentota bacterium]
MTETVEKVEPRHTKNEMLKRDGETGMAVGLFVLALGIPVLIGTLFTLDNHRAAIVNAISGLVLLLIGGWATIYGWVLFRRAGRHKDA